MPIQAVSSVKNNGYVNFEGRKKSQVTTQPVANSLKAVPVAVLIALSPFNKVEADAQVRNSNTNGIEVVQAKTYDKVLMDDGSPIGLKFRYISSDSNNQTVESIKAESQELFSFVEGGHRQIEYADVKSVNNYKLSLVGADGIPVGTITHSQLELRGMPNSEGRRKYYPIANETIVNDFINFAKSNKNNGAIQIKNVKNTLVAAPGKMPSTYNKLDKSWMEKTKFGNSNFATYNFGTLLREGNFSTEKNNYKIKFYSSDSDDNNIEVITCEREDGVRFKIDGLRILNLKIAAEESYDGEPMSFGCIDISWPDVGKFTIFDNELFYALAELNQNKDYAKAFGLSQANYNIIINSDGSVLKENR